LVSELNLLKAIDISLNSLSKEIELYTSSSIPELEINSLILLEVANNDNKSLATGVND